MVLCSDYQLWKDVNFSSGLSLHCSGRLSTGQGLDNEHRDPMLLKLVDAVNVPYPTQIEKLRTGPSEQMVSFGMSVTA